MLNIPVILVLTIKFSSDVGFSIYIFCAGDHKRSRGRCQNKFLLRRTLYFLSGDLLRPRVHTDSDSLDLFEDVHIHSHGYLDHEKTPSVMINKSPIVNISPQDIRWFETFPFKHISQRGTPGIAALMDYSVFTAIVAVPVEGIRSRIHSSTILAFKCQRERHEGFGGNGASIRDINFSECEFLRCPLSFRQDNVEFSMIMQCSAMPDLIWAWDEKQTTKPFLRYFFCCLD